MITKHISQTFVNQAGFQFLWFQENSPSLWHVNLYGYICTYLLRWAFYFVDGFNNDIGVPQCFHNIFLNKENLSPRCVRFTKFPWTKRERFIHLYNSTKTYNVLIYNVRIHIQHTILNRPEEDLCLEQNDDYIVSTFCKLMTSIH